MSLLDFLCFALYVLVAVVLGVALGMERQYRGHPAGLRTNALVCVGSALFVSLSGLLAGPGTDATRIASYVVSGIGFLGGGVILREGLTVRGMNTAATLWCSAAVGALTGAGFPAHATLGTATVLGINLGLRRLARWVDAGRKTAPDIDTVYQLRVVCEDRDKSVIRTILLRHVNAQSRMTVQSIATQDTEQPGRTAVLADVYATERSERAMEDIVRRLDIEPGVVAVSWSQRQ